MQDYHILYQLALSMGSLQELIERAEALFGYQLVLADSLHNIIAATDHIPELPRSRVTWHSLTELGLVPMPREPEADAAMQFRMPTEQMLQDPQPISTNCCRLPDGLCSYISDLRDGRHILMKAVVLHIPESEEAQRFACALCESLYFLYFRLVRTGVGVESGRGNYLHTLIHNGVPDTQLRERWLGISPPYILFLFSPPANGSSYQLLSRESNLLESNLGQAIRTIDDDDRIVMLFHIDGAPETFLARAETILTDLHTAAGISDPFYSLSDVYPAYNCARSNLEAAMDFTGFTGCADTRRFFLFSLFRHSLTATSSLNQLPPESRDALLESVERNPEPLCTLFVWLVCERNAPLAANRLFIHRNTLDNRISKLLSQLKLPLDSCCDSSRLLFSVWSVLRSRGLLQASWLRSDNEAPAAPEKDN